MTKLVLLFIVLFAVWFVLKLARVAIKLILFVMTLLAIAALFYYVKMR